MRGKMINNKKILAIIPARAGSKRIKDKNFLDLGGKPLITWTIEAAKKSKYIDHIYVSTDSEKIQTISKEYNVDAEPLRRAQLSGDHATSTDVILDIIQNTKTGYDLIVLLQPTSPLREASDIDGAIDLYFEKNAKSVVSVCEADCHPSWVSPIASDLKMDRMVDNLQVKRSQDLETHYMLNGAVYVMDHMEFLKEESFYLKEGTYSYIMSKGNSIDIDSVDDLKFAQVFISL